MSTNPEDSTVPPTGSGVELPAAQYFGSHAVPEDTPLHTADQLRAYSDERYGTLAERVAYWRQRAKSAEGHLPGSDMDSAAKAVHSTSSLSGINWDELNDSQRMACYRAASAAVSAINAKRDARKPKDAAIDSAGGDHG